MESEPVITRIADSIQQVQQQQQCPRTESQTGNSSDKPSVEETTNESNKAGNIPNGDECQKSHGWKGSLKRQLSKVDLKIKNTFTPSSVSSQNGVLVCFFNTCFTSRSPNVVNNLKFFFVFLLLLVYIYAKYLKMF